MAISKIDYLHSLIRRLSLIVMWLTFFVFHLTLFVIGLVALWFLQIPPQTLVVQFLTGLDIWRRCADGLRITLGKKTAKTPVIKVDVYKDDEAKVYFAVSDDVGLAVEAESLDDLMTEIQTAIEELLEIARHKA